MITQEKNNALKSSHATTVEQVIEMIGQANVHNNIEFLFISDFVKCIQTLSEAEFKEKLNETGHFYFIEE